MIGRVLSPTERLRLIDFYGTNPIDDSSTISMTAWNARKPCGKRPDWDAFLRNEANGGFGNDFNKPKITRHFSSSKPTSDCLIISVASFNCSEPRARHGDYQIISIGLQDGPNKARFLGNEPNEIFS